MNCLFHRAEKLKSTFQPEKGGKTIPEIRGKRFRNRRIQKSLKSRERTGQNQGNGEKSV